MECASQIHVMFDRRRTKHILNSSGDGHFRNKPARNSLDLAICTYRQQETSEAVVSLTDSHLDYAAQAYTWSRRGCATKGMIDRFVVDFTGFFTQHVTYNEDGNILRVQ